MLKKVILLVMISFSAIILSAQERKSELTHKSTFSIITEGRDIEKSTIITVHIKDENGFPMLGYIRLLNKQEKPIMHFMSDEEGCANLTLFDLEFAKFIVVDYLGYDRIKLPISKFRNKYTTLKVALKGHGTEN